jgi:hypothetical protein
LGGEDFFCRLRAGGESSSSEKLIPFDGGVGFVEVEIAASVSRFRLKVARFNSHSEVVGRIGFSMVKARLIEAAEKHLNKL